ncbi:MAG: UTP--glucose-1-phosphate uridylyltransferase [Clostridiales bacterium]|nr:MAG: UTP--glucose-1-phosphate uridylyltransferase [Clostridiales bacterium]
MKIRKVVIPAAGLGTRFLPATKAQPKEMLPIVDKPTIQYIVEEAVASGIESIIIITGKSKRAIEDHFDSSVELETELEKKHKTELLKVSQDISNMVNLYYVRQKHPLGLGHAVLCAKDFIGNEPFGVMLGDDIMVSEKPVLKQLIEEYERQNATVVGVKQVAHDEVNKYGVIKTLSDSGKLHKIEDLVEKPPIAEAPSNLAVMGRYVISPSIFPMLEKTGEGAGGEIQLTDALRLLLTSEQIYGYEFEGKRYDTGDKLGFLKATVDFALARDDLREGFAEYLRQKAAEL